MREPVVTVEITNRQRYYRTAAGRVQATQWRVKLAGIKGSLGVRDFTVWAEKHSALGKRLLNNPMARERVMSELPRGNAYEWIWF